MLVVGTMIKTGLALLAYVTEHPLYCTPMTPTHRLLSFLLALLFSTSGFAQHLEKGLNYYAKRTEGAVGLKAPADNIDMAIAEFRLAYSNKEDEHQSGCLLVEALTWKARFVVPEKEEKHVFREAKDIAEEVVKKYPESPRARFDVIAAMGQWGERIGMMKAATEGIVNKVRKHAEAIIEIDPTYANGVGYRTIGILNYEIPSIPFILSWPDKKKALSLIGKCLEYDPNDLGSNYYYAEALMENGKNTEAKQYLEKVMTLQPRQETLLEERAFKDWAKKHLQTFEADQGR